MKKKFDFSQGELEVLFKQFDKNNNDRLSIDAFASEINNENSPKNKKETQRDQKTTNLDVIANAIQSEMEKSHRTLEELFDQFNVSERGQLKYNEFEKLLNFLIGSSISKEECERQFRFLDKNDNRVISKLEFTSTFEKLIKTPQSRKQSPLLKKFISSSAKQIKKNSLTIDELFYQFNKKDKGMLIYHEFDKMILSLELEFTIEESKSL